MRIEGVAFAWLALLGAPGLAQRVSGNEESMSILREAGALIPSIGEIQRPGAAFNIAGALATVQLLNKAEDRAEAMGAVASRLTLMGKWRQAAKIVRAAPANTPREAAYAGMAETSAGRGDFRHAFASARSIRREPQPMPKYADALVQIAIYQFRAGKRNAALRTLDKAADAVRRMEPVPVPPAFGLAAGYVNLVRQVSREGKAKMVSVVVERLASMIAQERIPTIQEGLVSYLVEAQAAIGNFAAAVHRVEQRPEGIWRDRSLIAIASEQARQGDSKGALVLADRVPRKSWTDGDLMGFARELDAGGDKTNALVTIGRISEARERALTLAYMGLDRAARSAEDAKSVVQLALEAAQTAGNEPTALGFVAVSHAFLGDLSGSLELIGGLRGEARYWPLQNVTMLMAAAGDKAEALRLARREDNTTVRLGALWSTASGILDRAAASSAKKTR
jgi:tetratricopeptide (TPR) repeat protein